MLPIIVKALTELNTLIDKGMEFPDAIFTVSQQFKFDDEATEKLTEAYDSQGA